MYRFIGVMFAIGVLVFANGCFETEEEYVLNPDGSGKVVLKAVFQPMNIMGGEEPGSEAEMKDGVRKILEKSSGVEAWKDVAFKRTDDGRISFAGTAYFKNLSKLDFEAGGLDNNLRPSFARTPDGNMVLELKNKKGSEGRAKAAPIQLAEEELAKRIRIEKAKYQQSRAMIAGMLGNMKIAMAFKVPGTLGKVTNFKKEEDGSLRINVKGEKLLKVMDEFVADDDWLRKQILAGKDMNDGPSTDALNEKLFGEKAPVRAVVTGALKPLFDYKAEVAAAKKAFPGLLKKLGITAAIPVAPAKGEGFKSLKVGGVRLVRPSDTKSDVRPFNWDAGYTLSLVGKLPGAVLSIGKGTVDKAVADNGENLLPAREWDRKIHFPRLSKDKTTVVFEVKLTVPGEDVKGLKEVSGTLEYSVSGGAKDVDLGIGDFKAGATGRELNASIRSIEKNEWEEGRQDLSLKLSVSKESVKSVAFYDKDGGKLDVSSYGYSSSGASTTFTYSIKGKFPEKGRIVVTVFENVKKYKIPFKISNVSLIGQPLK